MKKYVGTGEKYWVPHTLLDSVTFKGMSVGLAKILSSPLYNIGFCGITFGGMYSS